MKLPFLSTIREAYATRHEPEHMRILGNTIWHLALVAIAFIVVGALALGMWEFSRVTEILNAASEAGRKPRPVLDRTKLDQALRLIESREQKFNAAARSSTVIDPSR